jgi:hypothetical protein
MKRVLMPCSLLVTTFALVSLEAGLEAQPINLIAAKTMNESRDALHASSEASEVQFRKSMVSESHSILQPGTLPAAGLAPDELRSMPRTSPDTPVATRKSWISLKPGTRPLAIGTERDATEKYGANPGVLEVSFGHRH